MGKTTGITTAVCVKEETVKGTPVAPAGTDALPIIADPEISQNKNLVESLERINSYSLLDLIALRYGEGSLNLGFYMKRTGVNDTVVAPIDTLLKIGIGRKTINAGANVTYNLLRTSDTPLTFTTFVKIGGMVLQAAGCFIKDMAFPFQADTSEAAIHRAGMAGGFYRMRWAGITTITEALTTTDAGLTMAKVATALLVPNNDTTDADSYGIFTVGSFITVGALTTSHKITDIDPATGIITVTPAFGSNQALGSTIQGFFPTASLSGTPIAGHKGFLVYDGVDFGSVLSGSPHVMLPRRALVEEKNNLDYASDDAIDGRRIATIDALRSYFDPNGTPPQARTFALEHEATRKAIAVNIGNLTGFKWQHNFPAAITKNPKLGGDTGIITLEQIQAALGTSGDDEYNLVSL